jgi:hypothetical protein
MDASAPPRRRREVEDDDEGEPEEDDCLRPHENIWIHTRSAAHT